MTFLKRYFTANLFIALFCLAILFLEVIKLNIANLRVI